MPALFEQYVVIDYGTTHIKGILHRTTPRGDRILKVESLPLVSIGGNGSESEEESGDLLVYEYNMSRFIQSFFPEEQNFLINLPVARVFVRDITLPLTNIKQINEVIPIEVENQIPITLDDAEIIGHAWEIGEDSSKVITFTARHDTLEGAVKPFQNGQQQLRMISLDSVGLSGITGFLREEEYQGQVIGQIDIGGKQTILNIIQNGELVFTRKIQIGGNTITEHIVELLKTNWSEAEKIKIDLNQDLMNESVPANLTVSNLRITRNDYNSILSLARENLEELVQEVERSLLSQSCSEPVLFYLSGGSAGQKGITQFLSERLEREVRHYPLELSGRLDISSWATALGTGEHYRLKNDLKIDFLRSPFGNILKKAEFQYKLFIIPGAFAIAAAVVFFIAVIVGAWVDNKEIEIYVSQIKKVARGIPGLKVRGGIPAIIKQAKKICAEKLISEKSRSDSVSILEIMKDISDKMPSVAEMDFRLKRFKYNGKDIQFEANVQDYDKVNVLKKKLSGGRFFSNVQVVRQSNIPGGKVRASYRLTLKQNAKTLSRRCK